MSIIVRLLINLSFNDIKPLIKAIYQPYRDSHDSHYELEIFLKVALNTIALTRLYVLHHNLRSTLESFRMSVESSISKNVLSNTCSILRNQFTWFSWLKPIHNVKIPVIYFCFPFPLLFCNL
jgi:hypothetical protein